MRAYKDDDGYYYAQWSTNGKVSVCNPEKMEMRQIDNVPTNCKKIDQIDFLRALSKTKDKFIHQSYNR